MRNRYHDGRKSAEEFLSTNPTGAAVARYWKAAGQDEAFGQTCGKDNYAKGVKAVLRERALQPMTTVLVCGGRDYSNEDKLNDALDYFHKLYNFARLIHGGAAGADALAGKWAISRHIPMLMYTANWKLYGAAAGVIRNQLMLDNEKPDLLIAFPGGSGTTDMIRRAITAGVKVERI